MNPLTLDHIARQYANATGCDEATATQAAFVAAVLIADLTGRADIGDYFTERAGEMESKIEFRGFTQGGKAVDTGYEKSENWGWY